MRVRIKFTKNDYVKYLGHLDIMRSFQRFFNRANVKMTYSEGFNPHQKMNFALPLGVGICSTGEYLDAEISDGQNPAEICSRLDEVSGEGFDILQVRELQGNAEKGMAAVRYSSYEIILDSCRDLHTDAYFRQQSIPVQKKTKSGYKEVDIKQLLLEIRQDNDHLYLFLKAGSENNIKPELILQDLFSFQNFPFERDQIEIIRTELYAEDRIPLIDYQTL